jgi:hypothetical protein
VVTANQEIIRSGRLVSGQKQPQTLAAQAGGGGPERDLEKSIYQVEPRVFLSYPNAIF